MMKGIVFSVLLVLGTVGQGAGGRNEEAPLCGGLTVLQPDGELKEAMTRYGFTAYSYTDGTTVVRGLHYAPKVKRAQKFPMLIYLPWTASVSISRGSPWHGADHKSSGGRLHAD